jgi:radical SAM protein with 4Fe4S-binding SPASM domain
MEAFFGARSGWKETYSGYKIGEHLFLEWGERFDWPDEEGAFVGQNHGCWGLRDQVGVLCDGTVVPCCLDAEGAIALGNLFTQPLEKILGSPRAVALKKSLQMRRVSEALCCRCGYAHKKNY